MKKITSILFQIIIFILACFSVLVLTYIIARPYLIGNDLWGNDAYSFFAVVDWINRYFPKVPFWYPISGGGVSLISAYPTLSAYIISIISRLSNFDLVQSFRLFGFLTVPFLAIGVFFVVLTRLTSIKSGFVRAILGFVASLFVVVSPNSWLWLTRWGFYAETSSYIFVPFAILFYDLFLENCIEDKKGWKFRIGLIGTIIFSYLSFMSHFLALASLFVFFAFYTLVRIFLIKNEKIKTFKRVFKYGLILLVFFAGIILYKYFAYKFYMDQVAFGGFIGYGKRAWQELANNTLPLKMMLSLDKPTTILDPHSLIFDMRFHLFVWILFFIGAIVSIKKSPKVFAFSIYGIVGLILSSILPIKYFLSGIPFLGSIFNLFEDRSFLIIARVIVPVVAIYGAYIFWEIIFTKIIPKIKFLILSLSLLVSLFFVWFLFSKLYYKPYEFNFMFGTGAFNGVLDLRDVWGEKPSSSGFLYGPLYDFVIENPEYRLADFYYMRDICLKTPMTLIDVKSVCGEFLDQKELLFPSKESLKLAENDCLIDKKTGEKYRFCEAFYTSLEDQLKLSNWPKFNISSDISKKKKAVDDVFDILPKDNNFRYDLSGFTGNVIMATPIFRNNSQLQIYINTASLIYNSWNYLGQVMYTPSNNYQKPGVLTELGKWFGLDYVFLIGSDLEPIEYWKTDLNWENLGNWQKFNQSTGIASWSNKPKVLIVTDVKRGLFDQFFRFATQGGLSYDTANLVIGEKRVDGYSLKELKTYDAIIMRGYGYKSTTGAYKLLDSYIKDGGVLFFDTGWQYEIPDYEIKKAPEFMPFESLAWKNLSINSKFVLESKYNSNVDISSLGDMTYGEGSWGVSVPSKLRSWAKTILSYDNTPLIIEGNYGKGKVIWSGFNIIAHSIAKDSQSEAILFGDIIKNSLEVKEINSSSLKYTRKSPDSIEFYIDKETNDNSQIYFKEAYFPYWNARLIKADGKDIKLKISKSGPGFMLIDLPPVSRGDSVKLTLKLGILQIIVTVFSVMSFMGLILFVLFPNIYNKIKFPKPNIKLRLPFKNIQKDENEEY